MSRVAVLGGGIVGLSVAWELAGRGADVLLLDRNRLARKASWAGAGLLVPCNLNTSTHPLEQLTGYSNQLHATWARRLKSETGIDNGYRKCGGVYLAWTSGEVASLVGMHQCWTEYGVPCEWLDVDAAIARVGGLTHPDRLKRILWTPDEAQIRNPDHLAALIEACRIGGVELIEEAGAIRVEPNEGGEHALRWQRETRPVDHVVVAAGAWSSELVRQLGAELPVEPVRGQMVLYRLERPVFQCVINVGSRYLVPRDDGHVLVGSTTEEVGFCEQTSATAIAELQEFAFDVCRELTSERCVRSWAGLRPASWDGVPYIGRVPGFETIWIAAGHFKIGLQQSPGTAVMLADLIEGRRPKIDSAPFDPARVLVGRS